MIKDFIDIAANLEFGILIAIILVALLMFSINALNNRKKLNVLSFIIGLVLIPILTFQMSSLLGACSLYDSSSDLTNLVGTVSPTLSKYISSGTGHDIGWFIFRRIFWSLLFLALGGFAIYITMDRRITRSHGRPQGVRIDRRYHTTSSRHRRY